MHCMKCGKDIKGNGVFCLDCLDVMGRFPVKPDTALYIPPKPAAPVVVAQSEGSSGDGAVFSALVNSKSFQTMIRSVVLDVLRSPEGQDILRQAIRKEMPNNRK